MTKTFPAKLEELNNVLGFVEEALTVADCPLKTQMALNVCIEEVFVNIANYAYPESEGVAEVRVEVDEPTKCVCICLSDSGVPFNPLEKEDPDTTLSVDERGIGGLGIYMVKKMTDSVSYEYEDGWNVLTMKKFF